MWDNSRPVKMLKTLRYDSVALQHIIDVDKYIASDKEGCDLCHAYMPYCAFCNRWVKNPCAMAYFVGEHFLVVCGIIDQCGVTEPAVVQAITDVDKYLVSETADFDICGRYAPFCAVCDKRVANPCATAYFRYKALGLGGELPKIEPKDEQVVSVSTSSAAYGSEAGAASAAAAVTAYEPEISVAAQPYMIPAESSDSAGLLGDGAIIPMRRTGIKIATARRRFPVVREEDGCVN